MLFESTMDSTAVKYLKLKTPNVVTNECTMSSFLIARHGSLYLHLSFMFFLAALGERSGCKGIDRRWPSLYLLWLVNVLLIIINMICWIAFCIDSVEVGSQIPARR